MKHIKIIRLKEVDSTNSFCKRYPADRLKGALVVIAKRQTGGRGTKGRSFSSEEGGLYLSIMRKPRNFDFSDTFSVMINSCVAVCKTLEKWGLNPIIKWPNDVLVGGKKISGTLIENTLLSGNALLSIVGIGINVNNELPSYLADTATSVRAQKGGKVRLNRVAHILVRQLGKSFTVEEYKRYINWFGKQIKLICNDKEITALAVDVDNDGSLVCEIGGEIKKINSAEISARLL